LYQFFNKFNCQQQNNFFETKYRFFAMLKQR